MRVGYAVQVVRGVSALLEAPLRGLYLFRLAVYDSARDQLRYWLVDRLCDYTWRGRVLSSMLGSIGCLRAEYSLCEARPSVTSLDHTVLLPLRVLAV